MPMGKNKEATTLCSNEGVIVRTGSSRMYPLWSYKSSAVCVVLIGLSAIVV